MVETALIFDGVRGDQLLADMTNRAGDYVIEQRGAPRFFSVECTGDNDVNFETLPLQPIKSLGARNWFEACGEWTCDGVCSSADDLYSRMTQLLKEFGMRGVGDLPVGIRPQVPYPDGTCINHLVLQQLDEQRFRVLKQVSASTKVPLHTIQKSATGQIVGTPWRSQWQKTMVAVNQLVDLVPGWHVSFSDVVPKETDSPNPDVESQRPSAKTWQPTSQEIDAGVGFINKHAPTCIGNNQQFGWILKELQDPRSPIYGWPRAVVKEACANKLKSKNQTDPESWFALLIPDLKAVFVLYILPLICPYLATCGLLLVGVPGVGKTQLAKILAMAFGRLYKRMFNILDAVPGFRRTTSMDGLREQEGEICDGIHVCPKLALECYFQSGSSF